VTPEQRISAETALPGEGSAFFGPGAGILQEERIVNEHELAIRVKPDMGAAGSPVVVHIPHSASFIPIEERGRLAIDSGELRRELLRMTDWFTDELFDLPRRHATRVVYPWSRLLADPERYEDDDQEPMTARGMGAVYTATSQGGVLREGVTEEERKRLLAAYYRPHHAALTRAVAGAVRAHGHCLLIDAHSFPTEPLPCDVDQSRPRPDICIGTDGSHTPSGVRDAAVEAFSGAGYSVAVDRPYAGTMIPADFFGDPRVRSIMIEVRRGLYMDEATGLRNGTFGATRLTLQSSISSVAAACEVEATRRDAVPR
jgi:N-formylglutamate amidohydrolase